MASLSDARAALFQQKWVPLIPLPKVDPESTIDRIKKLAEINAMIDSIITDENNNELPAKSKNTKKKVKKSAARATSSRLSHPWANDVLHIVVGDSCDEDDDSPEAVLKNHYVRNPWFYDTLTHCVSMRIYGGRQHAFVKQYYQEPKLWKGNWRGEGRD